jgi:nitroreductase
MTDPAPPATPAPSATPPAAHAFAQLLQQHRSIRQFSDRSVDPALLDDALARALQGSSSSGNLNMVSVIRTLDPQRKARLHELHGEQPMVLQAPCVLTFCADSYRTRQWLQQRGARLGFGDLISWHVCAFDAVILAQSTALALEAAGLGICYMGTTLHAMRELADFLECPDHCLPVTSLVVGWPAEAPPPRDRLPAEAWIHAERYQRPTSDDIDRRFAQREERGRQRYLDSSPEMARLWTDHGIGSLAQYYTSRIKYDPDRFAADSAALEALLRERGFLA